MTLRKWLAELLHSWGQRFNLWSLRLDRAEWERSSACPEMTKDAEGYDALICAGCSRKFLSDKEWVEHLRSGCKPVIEGDGNV